MRIYPNNNLVRNNTQPNSESSSYVGAPVLNYGFNGLLYPDNSYDAIQLPPAIKGSVVIGFFLDGLFPSNNIITVYPNQDTDDVINDQATTQTAWDFPSNWGMGFPEVHPILLCICLYDGTWFIGGQID